MSGLRGLFEGEIRWRDKQIIHDRYDYVLIEQSSGREGKDDYQWVMEMSHLLRAEATVCLTDRFSGS